MKILLTGGTGLIGAGALRELLVAGHQVRLLSRHAGQEAPAFPAAVETRAADVSDRASLTGAFAGCDAVVHIAGIVEERPPELTFEKINVDGTRHVVEAAEASGRPFLLFISSLGADRGASGYHQSKRRAEEIVQRYSGSWLILRPGSVYGPGDETLSLLLKMVRTAPAVPVVSDGEQPFQPLWYEDFGAVIAQAVAHPELAGNILEVAGPDVTTTNGVLDRLALVTGRTPPRVPVPEWLARFGTSAGETLGGSGKSLLARAGLGSPLNPAKLQMLVEGNVIADPARNALATHFDVTPTSLDEGLELLADASPEQTPGEGVGAITRSEYFADIRGTGHSPASLLDLACNRLTDVMAVEFAAEPGAPRRAEHGTTFTGAIAGRGNFQVRVQERTDTRMTFVTLDGHPLAGVVTFACEPRDEAVRFAVHVTAQAANIFDWAAMQAIGGMMQRRNWRKVVRRMIELSGGDAPQGVQQTNRELDEAEAHQLQAWAESLVQERKRAELERDVAATQRPVER